MRVQVWWIIILGIFLGGHKSSATRRSAAARWAPTKCECPCDNVVNKVKGADGIWYATADQVPPSEKIRKEKGKYVGYGLGKCGAGGEFCQKESCPLSMPTISTAGDQACNNWAVASPSNANANTNHHLRCLENPQLGCGFSKRTPTDAILSIIKRYPWATNSLILDDGSSWWTGQDRKKAGTLRGNESGLGMVLSETHQLVPEWYSKVCNSRILMSCMPLPAASHATLSPCKTDDVYQYTWDQWFPHADGCGKEVRREVEICLARCGCTCTSDSKRALKTETRNRFSVCAKESRTAECTAGIDLSWLRPASYLKENNENLLRKELRITSASNDLSDLDLQRLCRHFDAHVFSKPRFHYINEQQQQQKEKTNIDEPTAGKSDRERKADGQQGSHTDGLPAVEQFDPDLDAVSNKRDDAEIFVLDNSEWFGLAVLAAASFVVPDRPHLHLIVGGLLVVVSVAVLAGNLELTIKVALCIEMASMFAIAILFAWLLS